MLCVRQALEAQLAGKEDEVGSQQLEIQDIQDRCDALQEVGMSCA